MTTKQPRMTDATKLINRTIKRKISTTAKKGKKQTETRRKKIPEELKKKSTSRMKMTRRKERMSRRGMTTKQAERIK